MDKRQAQADGDIITALCSFPKIISEDGQDYVQLADVLETVRRYKPQTDGEYINRILKRMWNWRSKNTTSIDKVAMEMILREELPSVAMPTNGEYILKSEAIKTIQQHGVGCFDADDFTPEQCERYVIKLLQDLKPSVAIPSAEPCENAISRQAVLEMAYDMSEIDGEHFTEPCMVVDVEDIQKLPSVKPQEKTGHWTRELIRNEKGGCIGAKMICSECGNDNKHDEYMNYCPNCGKKMDERREVRDKV